MGSVKTQRLGDSAKPVCWHIQLVNRDRGIPSMRCDTPSSALPWLGNASLESSKSSEGQVPSVKSTFSSTPSNSFFHHISLVEQKGRALERWQSRAFIGIQIFWFVGDAASLLTWKLLEKARYYLQDIVIPVYRTYMGYNISTSPLYL